MIKLNNVFKITHRDVNGHILGVYEIFNAITNIGKDYLLDAGFAGASAQVAYAGLIDNTNFSDVDVDDTISSHPGWQEFNGYSDLTLPDWLSTGDVSASQVLQNATPFEFNLNANGSVRGVYIVLGDNARADITGGNSGLLWATALFNEGAIGVSDGDTFTCNYEIRWAS
jgi:hypothetical protein